MPGRIFKDISLPGMSAQDRSAVYTSMCDVLSKIHKVNIEQAELTGYGKQGENVTVSYVKQGENVTVSYVKQGENVTVSYVKQGENVTVSYVICHQSTSQHLCLGI